VGLAIYRGRHGDAALERTIGAVMSWADEYRAGDHEGVWRKLTELGPGLRQDCAAWDDATEVARETMRHVRANVERLHAALLEDGYRFDRPDDALVAPAADAHDRLDQVERVVGPLPLSLRGWIEVVGSVNFVGVHPEWDFEYADPLVVDCPIDHIVREYEEREASGWFEEEDTDRFPLDLALTTCTRRTSAAERRTRSGCPTPQPMRAGSSTTCTRRRSPGTCVRRCSTGVGSLGGRAARARLGGAHGAMATPPG
jgi:hypothetical protein